MIGSIEDQLYGYKRKEKCIESYLLRLCKAQQ